MSQKHNNSAQKWQAEEQASLDDGQTNNEGSRSIDKPAAGTGYVVTLQDLSPDDNHTILISLSLEQQQQQRRNKDLQAFL